MSLDKPASRKSDCGQGHNVLVMCVHIAPLLQLPYTLNRWVPIERKPGQLVAFLLFEGVSLPLIYICKTIEVVHPYIQAIIDYIFKCE